MGNTQRTGLTLPSANSIPDWLLRGAIREDDNTKETLPGTPEGDEPGGVFDRVFGHFFDPVNNRGMTVLGDNLGPRAPEWATLPGAVVTGIGFGSRQNYYNLPSAREAMWRALTLKRILANGTFEQITPIGGLISYAADEAERKAYWATMFRSIGDVVHLVQDMAQPQHTRNDPHSGYACVAYTGACAGGHASFAENYLKARTLRAETFLLREGFLSLGPGQELSVSNPQQLDYWGYPKPMFAKAEDFFSTATGTGNATGAGLANYSNRGFYSFGTNVSNSVFPSPAQYGAGLGTETIDGDDPDANKKLKNLAGTTLPGVKLTIRTGTVTDTAGGPTEANVRLTTQGYWDQFIDQQSAFRHYTLNYYNYDAQAKLLIPRAVAYSAGLIDYFFRGQLEITPPDEGVYSLLDHYDFSGDGKSATAVFGFKGFKTIKLKLRNATPDIMPSGGAAAAPQIMPGGTLVAVLKFYRNKNYTDDLGGEPATDTAMATAAYLAGRSANEEIVVSARVKDSAGALLAAPIAVASTPQTFVFEFDNELPINATDVQLQVVYRGTLGNEADAVVVQTIDISEPTYFTYMNATDYIKLGQSVYTRAEINAATPTGATLRSLVRPTTCIDTTTNQLKDIPTCFPPFGINFAAKWGSRVASNASVALPLEQTYQRLAMLVPSGGHASIIQSTSPCLPNDALNVAGRILQTNYVADNNVPPNYVPSTFVTYLPAPVRGVKGGYVVACVNNGDGATPGASSDDRFTKMTSLAGANLKPLPIGAFFFGAP